MSFVDEVTDNVIESLESIVANSDGTSFITVEDIQDQVERQLMESGHFLVMKNFIIYRNERIKQREKEKEKVEKQLEQKTFKIIKST
ncbi:MAG: ATP cone domain-containing protein [bacterium]|nr:ATP cone domain-containing protein [bacterium]MDP3380820.1 ATP cone domain-containing protein [bacterium]